MLISLLSSISLLTYNNNNYDDFILKLEQKLLLSEKEITIKRALSDKVKYLEEELFSFERNPTSYGDIDRSLTTYKATNELDYILRQPSEEKLRRSIKTKQMKDMVNSLNSYNF